MPYLAMLLAPEGMREGIWSPVWDAIRFMDAEPLPWMLWGEPNDGVLPAEGLMRGIWCTLDGWPCIGKPP